MGVWDQPTRLRGLLGDSLAQGQDPTDAFFTDDQIASLLLDAEGNLNRAAYEGWSMKAAAYAELVTVTEGNASRQMSDLQAHALAMVKHFQSASSDLTNGRTRIGRIRRLV